MKLKPCPFCGETDANVEQSILDYRRYVYCKSCNARVGPFESDAEGQVIGQDTKAVAFWNTRPAEDVLRAEVERLTARLAEATALLRAVVPVEPMNQDEQGGCVWCGKPVGNLGYGYATADPADHNDDCAWLRAAEWLAAQETEQ